VPSISKAKSWVTSRHEPIKIMLLLIKLETPSACDA
jgi:hypothetical protein